MKYFLFLLTKINLNCVYLHLITNLMELMIDFSKIYKDNLEILGFRGSGSLKTRI